MKKLLLLFSLIATIGLQAQNFWTEVAPFLADQSYIPKQISIVDANVVWVNGYDYANPANYNQKWARSTDGGVNWSNGLINLGNSDLNIGSIHAVSATTAYVTAFATVPFPSTGGVWITQDSGASWTKQTTALFETADSFPNFIHFWNANNGIVVGDPESNYFEIYTTTNGGTNWVRVPSANIPGLMTGEYAYTLNFEVKENTIWFGTNNGRIFKSDNNGLNWTVAQSPLTDFSSAANGGHYAFKNQNNGLLVSANTDNNANWDLWRTTDGGISWNPEIATGALRNGALINVPETANTYFSIGTDFATSGRGSSYSTNGGLTWIDLNDVDVDPVMPSSAEFKTGTVGFCIGTYQSAIPALANQKFFRLTDPLNRFLKADDFALKNKIAVVPNPTSGLVKISGANIKQVVVYDMLGKEILSDSFSALNEITFDMTNYRSGIYLARVTSDSGSSSTIKIVRN